MANLFTKFGFSVSKLLCPIALLAAAVCVPDAQAAVNWRIHAGGMYGIRGIYTDDASNFTALLGVEIQFPIQNKFFIETGLNVLAAPTTFTEGFLPDAINEASTYKVPLKDFDSSGEYIGSEYRNATISQGIGTFLNLPVRFSYRYRLKGDNEFQFAFGPYLNVYFDDNDFADESPLSVGLTPSVVFKHRALSLGIMYMNPCIYNGIKNRDTNTLLFTIGVNFNGRKINLDKLAAGLEVASAVMNTANATLQQYAEATGAGDSGYDSDSSYSSSSSSYSSSSSSSRGSDTSLTKSTNAQHDRNTYFKNETLVQRILSGDDTVNKKSDIQREMKRIRNKWKGSPYEWQASEWETK